MRPADEPGPAVLETVEPVDDVPFDELLGGVQEDLPARQGGVHPDQVHRILELIPEPIRPAGLVEPTTRPDALGQCLVFQPIQVAVELGVVGLDPQRIHQAEPPPPGRFECGEGGVGIAILVDDRPGPLAVIGLAQDHGNRVLAVCGNVDRGRAARRSAGRPRCGRVSGSPRSIR